MSPGNLNQDEDKIKPWPREKWVIMICLVILVSFGIKLLSWTRQYDIYHSLFIVILSFLGIFWLIFIWIDLYRMRLRLKHSLDNPSTVTLTEWTYYTYLKAPHSYCFYLKVGLTIFCFIHLMLTTTLIVQEINYLTYWSNCFDSLRLLSSTTDLITSILQLIFILIHSNLIINRHKTISHVGCMIFIAIGLLKWYMTIAAEADSKSSDNQSKFDVHHHVNDQSYQDCPTGTLYNLKIGNLLPYIDPFTIEFNFLLAIQWLIIWLHIGRYKETHSSDYWSITEAYATNDEIDELTQSITLHKSGRGLFAGLFCFLGALVSLIYYFSAIGDPSLSATILYFTKWEDLIYLTSSLFTMLIASLQLSRLGKSTSSCIGSTDLLLLFIPLIAFSIRGYIRISGVYSEDLIDKPVEILGIVQPLLQAAFIYFAKSKICDTTYLNQHKPGRQMITLLIALNLVIWVSGAFRAKAKLQNSNSNQIVDSIFLDVCQPFILFYRYHASVCLANIWKIVYSYT